MLVGDGTSQTRSQVSDVNEDSSITITEVNQLTPLINSPHSPQGIPASPNASVCQNVRSSRAPKVISDRPSTSTKFDPVNGKEILSTSKKSRMDDLANCDKTGNVGISNSDESVSINVTNNSNTG